MDHYFKVIGELLQLNNYVESKSQFLALPDSPSRVNFILNMLKENRLVPKINQPNPKDDAVSKRHRDAANTLYRQKKYVAALVSYNEAICHAGTEGLSLAYANRSLIYLSLKLYDVCLDNIRLAREAGYPANLLPKLADREKQCHEAMVTKRTVKPKNVYQPKLSYPASAQNPNIADAIKLAVNEKYGRHYVAKQDLKVGDILLLERPYQVYLHNDYKYQKCANCLKENQLNLIPCPGCTNTMFCSLSCMEQAQKYHKTFCPVSRQIHQMTPSNWFFAFRILLSQIHEFGSFEALVAARRRNLEKSPSTAELGDDGKIRQLHAFQDLKKCHEPISFGSAIPLSLMYYYLIENTDLADKLVGKKSRDLFLDMLFQYKSICEMNAHSSCILDRNDRNPMLEFDCIGSNISLALSLINHSCAANIMVRPCNESLMAGIVIRPIKKGRQLFCSYGPHHDNHSKKNRQMMLKETYKFTCECEACVKDYPTYSGLPMTLAPSSFWEMPINSSQKAHLRMLKDCKKYYQKHASSYPSRALYNTWLVLLYSFGVLCGNYTLNACVD